MCLYILRSVLFCDLSPSNLVQMNSSISYGDSLIIEVVTELVSTLAMKTKSLRLARSYQKYFDLLKISFLRGLYCFIDPISNNKSRFKKKKHTIQCILNSIDIGNRQLSSIEGFQN